MGELADYGSGRSKAMGGTSFGIRNNRGVNAANPASYTCIDSLSFIFEFGAMGKESIFTDSNNKRDNSFNANIEFLTLRFPIGRWFAASVGITPYSYVGYSFPTNGQVITEGTSGADTISYQRNYKGTGGLNEIYGGLAAKIGKHVSLGINAYYLFGTIQNTRQVTFDATYGSFYSTLQDSKLKISDFNIRYGLQYYTPIKQKHFLTVGAIFEMKNRLGGKYSVETSTVDTISEKNGSKFDTPMTIGGGVSYSYTNKLTVGADVLYQGWSDAKYFGVSDTLTDRMKFSIGTEYTPDPFAKNYFKRISYRLGANISTGYLDIKGSNIANYGITFGFGLPARGGRSAINIGVEYGRLGNNSYGQIREDYFKFSLSASFNEFWFFKRRFE
ncbi:MAG: hypothetical protein J6W49_02755 [Paludibacteraceae bacterium]|nr:hypothetical protein [Paludibacteraceae bacterium]MBP5135997.1 hypothetical protein [Paludibacteraceae bacterium]MBP5742345.1 hypothetical protein [Paludibacteraceae bacterium]